MDDHARVVELEAPRGLSNHAREEVKKQAKTILGSMSQESMKKRISQMFDTLRDYRKTSNPIYEEFAEEVRIWDDVYHDLKLKW
jgi:hypothetical protein